MIMYSWSYLYSAFVCDLVFRRQHILPLSYSSAASDVYRDSSYTNQQLKDVVRDLNKKVNSSAMGEKYITMFIGLWNNKTRELVYINCGHNPPLLENGTENIIELTDGSLGLGMLEEIPSISEGSVFIKPNSRLVCFTDGLVEIENDQMQEFGIERVMEILEKNPTASSEQKNNRLIQN